MFQFENKPSSRIMLEKKSYRCMSGKKILSREVWEKNLTQTKSPIPLLKSQMVGSQFLSR